MPGTSRTQATNTPADPSSASGRTTTRTDGAAPTTPNRDHTPTRSGVADTEHVFWVYGISCLDCAAKFEKNVATLPGVVAANLNTTTGKLSVVGHADVDTIRRLGRAEDYTITTKRNDDAPSEVHAARMELWRAGVSAALLLSRWRCSMCCPVSTFFQLASPMQCCTLPHPSPFSALRLTRQQLPSAGP